MKGWLTFALAVWPTLAAAQAPSATAPMSLREAVSYALAHSPELKASQAEVDRRQGLATTGRSFLLPQLDASGDASRTRLEHGYPLGATPLDLRYDTAIYTGALDLKLLVWDFGRTERELAATREGIAIARGTVDRRRQEIIFETARLYLQTLAYADLIRAADGRIESLRSLLDRTNRLVEAGRAVPVDALKIQTRLAQIESDLAALHAGRRTSVSGLAAVMGFEGAEPVVSDTSSAPSPAGSSPENRLLEDAAASRPDLVSKDHEVRAGEHAVEAARRSVWPRIDFRASVIEYGSGSPAGFPQLIGGLLPGFVGPATAPDGLATDWLVGVHVSVPIFDGGRRRGQVQAAVAQAEEARLGRQQLGLRVAREVRSAQADLDSARSRVRALHDSVAESERVLHDERLKYEAGRSVVNFVLDAEAALLTNQSLLSQAERSATIASLALDLAVGRIDVDRLP